MRICEVHDLGRVPFPAAWDRQKQLAERRKRGEIPDQLLFLEHPPVLTMGRNGRMSNVLVAPEILERAGIGLHHIDRGGDVTFHGPGQIVAYPIVDLREWKRDVLAFVRALEDVVIAALADLGFRAERNPGKTGVWIDGAKVAAIGIHLSRWVTTHGFALNVDTELSYFRYIVPCGLTEPVTSLRALGSEAGREQVIDRLVDHFGRRFGAEMRVLATEESFS